MKKLIYPLAFTLTAFLIIYSCSAEEDNSPPPSIIQTPEPETPAPTQYTLTVSAGEGGTVSTEGGTYDEGTDVSVTAVPENGFQFVRWSDGEEAITRTISMNQNTLIYAEFYIKMPSYERYSFINETTSSFQKQKYFYRYLSKEEYKDLAWYDLSGETTFCNWGIGGGQEGTCYGFWPNYRVHGSYDTWGDFNNDNKLDYFASSWTFTPDNKFGNEKSQFIFISDYFSSDSQTKSVLQSDYINWASPTSIADFDNNGFLDVLVLHNNRHNNAVNWNPNQITENSGERVSPGQPVIIYFEPDGKYREVPFGPNNIDTHQSTSGDIDGDGDIDVVMFPWYTQNEGLSNSPKILLNNGSGNFETIELLSDYESFIQEYPFNWNLLSFNIFDLNGDGNMDIVGGTILSDIPEDVEMAQIWEYKDENEKGFHNNRKPWIIWGTDDLQYSSANIVTLDKIEHRYKSNLLGSGFTDFDSDGDIDIILISTVVDGDIFYKNYELTLFENKGDKVFEDVTNEKIDFYYNLDASKFGEFYSIAMIDKDEDGDFDIVPYSAGNMFGGEEYITNLYWENTGSQFVRRQN